MIFPEKWSVLADQVKTDVPVLIKGGYPRRDQTADNPSFIAESITRLAEPERTDRYDIESSRKDAGLDPQVGATCARLPTHFRRCTAGDQLQRRQRVAGKASLPQFDPRGQ